MTKTYICQHLVPITAMMDFVSVPKVSNWVPKILQNFASIVLAQLGLADSIFDSFDRTLFHGFPGGPCD